MILKRYALAVLLSLLLATSVGSSALAAGQFQGAGDSIASSVQTVPAQAPSTQEPPKRSDVPVQYTWDLESIYPNDDLWEADLQAVKQQLPQLAAYHGTLDQSAA